MKTALFLLGLTALFSLWETRYVAPTLESTLVAFMAEDGTRLTRHLAAPFEESPDLLRSEHLPDGFATATLAAMADFGVHEVNLFAADGTILWASDNVGIGTRNQHTYFHEIVTQGKKFSKLERRRLTVANQPPAVRDLVETYTPLMADGRFIGAIEIYYDVTDRRAELAAITRRTLMLAGMLATGLLAAMLVIRRRQLRRRQQMTAPTERSSP